MKRLGGPLLFILATLLIDAVGVGIVFPIMPDLMERVGAGSTAQGSIWAGILMASYGLAQFVCAPVIGSISDAYGRKPVLLAAMGFLVLDYVIMALAEDLWLLLLGRTLAGIAGATYITATAYIADITPKEQRAARFGLIGAAYGIGFVFGPALGGLAATWHVTAPFWLAAGLAAANVAFGLFVLPESLALDKRRPFGLRDVNPLAAIWQAFRMPGLAVPLACMFVFEFANMVYPTLWAFWGRETFGWSALVIGITLSAYGMLVAGVQGGLMAPLVRALGEHRLMILGLVVSTVALAAFGFASAIWVVAVFLPLAALSDIVPPTLTALAANVTDEDRQGLLQGVIAALGSVAAVAAPLVFTGAFRGFVGDGAPLYLPGAPFLLAAVMVAAIVPLAWISARRQIRSQAASSQTANSQTVV